MEQLTEGELAMLLQACDLQIRAFRYGVERAEEEVEKLNFTARIERMLSAQEKIGTELASRRHSPNYWD